MKTNRSSTKTKNAPKAAANSTGRNGKTLTKTVKEKALSLGAHLVGVAPLERMDASPPDLHPRRLMPDARSIISLGFRINEGVIALDSATVRPVIVINVQVPVLVALDEVDAAPAAIVGLAAFAVFFRPLLPEQVVVEVETGVVA